MSELVESTATAERQAEAEKMGWIPPARFKGEAERFIDAEDYITRGETVLPIVKQQLASTRDQLAGLSKVSAEQTRLIAELKAAKDEQDLRFSAEKQRAVERAREEIRAELVQASADGDHKAVATLTEALVTNAQELAEVKTPVAKKDPPPPADPEQDPTYLAWKADNPWFDTDRRKRALALGIAEDLRANGDKTMGRAFYDKISEELEATLAPKPAPTGDKVQGGGRNGGGGDSGGKSSYDRLPADAKAVCDADMKRFVGKGKKFETQAEARAHYANIYFNS